MKNELNPHQLSYPLIPQKSKFITQFHDFKTDEYYSEMYDSKIERFVHMLYMAECDDWDLSPNDLSQLFNEGFLADGYDTIQFLEKPLPIIRAMNIRVEDEDKRTMFFENMETGERYVQSYSDTLQGLNQSLSLRHYYTNEPVYGHIQRWMQIRRAGFDHNSRELFENVNTGEMYVDTEMDYSFHDGMRLSTICGTEPDVPVDSAFEIID